MIPSTANTILHSSCLRGSESRLYLEVIRDQIQQQVPLNLSTVVCLLHQAHF
jgi:hypothetical protein